MTLWSTESINIVESTDILNEFTNTYDIYESKISVHLYIHTYIHIQVVSNLKLIICVAKIH